MFFRLSRAACAAIVLSWIAVNATFPAHADTFGPGPGGSIPDATTSSTAPGTFTSTITIVNPGAIVSLDSVTLTSLVHTWVGDLEVTLTAPNGDDVHLFSRVGVTTATGSGENSNLNGTYMFVNSGGANFPATAIALGNNDITPSGTYDRSTAANASVAGGQDLDTFSIFAGDPVAGTWSLTISDWFELDTGTLGSWTLDFTLQPAQAPEPATLALLAIAFAAFGVRRRKRVI